MEPLRIEFSVACSLARAFEVWTAESIWGVSRGAAAGVGGRSPLGSNGHTVSADPGLTVTLEPRVGGRIFERTPEGVEHDWGEVLTWEPPGRLVYLWHLRVDRADATEVEITFAGAEDTTAAGSGWARRAPSAASETSAAGPACSSTTAGPRSRERSASAGPGRA